MNNYESHTDDHLVCQYLEGNNAAFSTLLNRHKDKVFSFINSKIRDEDVANDIFQDTFIKVVVNIREGKYTNDGKFIHWTMRIARNLVIDHFRKQSTENTVSQDDDMHTNLENLISLMEGNVQDALMYEDTLKEVEKLMYALPESQREIVYMRFYQDLSFKEISETLDISINTALGRMRYAVLNMKKMAVKYECLN